MIPVYQTKFTTKDGDCMSACLASILECDLSDIPNFTEKRSDEMNMWAAMREWLGIIGYALVIVSTDTFMVIPSGRELFAIAGVPSQKLEGDHSVVVKISSKRPMHRLIEIAHDPNPNNKPYRGGDIGDINFLVPMI